MSISLVQDKIPVRTKDDVLKYHLMIKSYQKGYNLSHSDIETLVELNNLGYNKEFIESCVHKGYWKSEQSVVNAVCRMTSLGIIMSPKKGVRFINREVFPDVVDAEKVIFKYMVGNL